MTNNTPVKTILILAANPTNTVPLRLEQEIREIDEGLRRANQREQYKLEQKWAVRSRDFYRAILDYQPNIVHFCGHGAGQDGIVLEDDTGKMALVQTNALASMFKLFAKKGVECVILNACYSEVQAEAISHYVNYVIGMNKAVGDKASIAFAVAFYDAVAAGYQVEEAYELGCSQMIGFLEHETPVFKKKNLIYALGEDSLSSFECVIPPNPYQGLSAFKEEDAYFFFGQENFVTKLVEVTNKQPLVAVVGPSGSGKSSVVYAGLIPQLRKAGNWLIESFRPGKNPFFPLASALVRQLEPEAGETQQLREAVALAGDLQNGKITLQQVVSRILERNPGKRLLLVADQFEELYTLCQVKEEQERFADALLTAIAQENITLVFTLRADFYGYVLSYRPFRDALQEYTPQLLSSMKREELQAAIELPAQKLEVELEPQLTQRILDDVGEEPGNLPLLEFALTRLWEKQINRELTHQAYEEIGGVKKAIANHAEQIYQQLSEIEKKQAQRIFVQLVRPGEGTEDTRRVATRAEVGEDNWNLVSYLAGYQARLVVTGRQEQEDTVEVVHEALIREWGTLREWMNANRQFRTWQERLKVALREWKNNNHDAGGLLRGALLTVAEDWLRKRADQMTQEERDFIQVSVKETDRERQQRERGRRLQIIGLSGFSSVAMMLAGFAIYQLQQAQRQQVEQLAATSKALLAANQPVEALVNAIAAVGLGKSTFVQFPQFLDNSARDNLLDAIFVNREFNRLQYKSEVNSIAISPNGKRIVSGSWDKTIRLWDATTGQPLGRPLKGHEAGVTSVAISPNGKLIVSGSWDKTIRLWDATTGQPLGKPLEGHGESISSVAFSPDGKRIASGSWDKTIRLWDTNTGQPIAQPLRGHKDGVTSVAFSRDGKRIVSGSSDKTIRLWNATGQPIAQPLTKHQETVDSVAFSPDGKRIVSGSGDNTIRLWDVTTGQSIGQPITGHQEAVYSVAFSLDGKQIVSGSLDKTIRLWDARGQPIGQPLTGHQEAVYSVAFSPDGKQIVSGSLDKTIRLWYVTMNQIVGESKELVNSVAFSSNSKGVASGHQDGTIRLWDVTTGQPLGKRLTGHQEAVWSVAFSPDGKRIVSGSEDKTIRLWDATTGQPLGKPLTGHQTAVLSVAFSPDGKRVVSGSEDNTIRLWNVTTGQPIGQPLKGHQEAVWSVTFSPDGKHVVSGSDDKTIRLWDVTTGQPIGKPLKEHLSEVYSVAFSPDGKRVASGGSDKTIHLWDVTSGQPIGQPLKGHQGTITSLAFSSNGKWIMSGSRDKTIRLWDANTGHLIGQPLKVYKAWVNSVAFSPDGKWIVSGSENTISLWPVSWLLSWQIPLEIACKQLQKHLIFIQPKSDSTQAAKKTCQQYIPAFGQSK
ncbi:CHAT domain-containing protein [Microcoleus sp. Pol7_A1]|uniref:nSTAND1 domain-containing NTPase n=1 Tax=Microcoleus sp. Pol7_A1 TaxID=2818893 RepID=UPI002FD45671